MSNSLDILLGTPVKQFQGRLPLSTQARRDWFQQLIEAGPSAMRGYKLGTAAALAMTGKNKREIDAETGMPKPFVIEAAECNPSSIDYNRRSAFHWFKGALSLFAPDHAVGYDIDFKTMSDIPYVETGFAYSEKSGMWLTAQCVGVTEIRTAHAELEEGTADVFAFDAYHEEVLIERGIPVADGFAARTNPAVKITGLV